MGRQGRPPPEMRWPSLWWNGLAPCADGFLLPFLPGVQRPLEQGQGRGLELAVPSLGLRRFPGQELGPGEEGLPTLGGFIVVTVARTNAKTPIQAAVPEDGQPHALAAATRSVTSLRAPEGEVRPSEQPQRLGLRLVRPFFVR